MDYAHPRYFDYLADYGDVLASQIRFPGLEKKITIWRKNGMEDPESAATGARKVIEHVLRCLVNDDGTTRGMKLVDLVDLAKRRKKISSSYAKRFTEVRKAGNDGAHRSVDAIRAKRTLVLLDEILRKYVAESLDKRVVYSIAVEEESPFVVRTSEEVRSFASDSSTAAALSGKRELEKTAATIKRAVEEKNAENATKQAELDSLFSKLEESGLGDAQQEKYLKQLDEQHERLVVSSRELDRRVARVEADVAEILSEHDFIKMLLGASGKGGQATKEQLDVLAFPKSRDAKTNVLQIAGGAGTGKTLCLLAKLIHETQGEGGGQADMFGGAYRSRALFLCFNKALAAHVRELLAAYEQIVEYVTVVSFDEFVNQLVRDKPKAGFEWLGKYACDVRYGQGWRITYETTGFASQAMSEVGQKQGVSGRRLVDGALKPYVDAADAANVEWMKDELSWIESRYASIESAEKLYPTATRIGRGGGRRPNEDARRAVLLVWRRFCELLGQRQRYTVEQAVKRLMVSESLPQYDCIAIDEVQDFAVLSVKLVRRLLRGKTSRMYLSGDERQKIYKRDFTWKEIGEGLRGYTITLKQGMRSTPSIYAFANRLLGEKSGFELASEDVVVAQASEADVLGRFRELGEAGGKAGQTTALIGGWEWFGRVAAAGIEVNNSLVTNQWGRREISDEGCVLSPGRYIVPEFKNKGLEFDNVIVVDGDLPDTEPDQELSLRYVHYSRARKHLEVLCMGAPSRILREHYADFLGRNSR